MVVQVEPMKRVLTAPRTTRLKSQYDTLLSNVAFGFNLRRYISEKLKNFASELRASGSTLVGRCRLTLSNPR
jgi:hypothetical protein